MTTLALDPTRQQTRLQGSRPVHVLHVVQNLNTGGLERLLIEMLKLTDPNVVSSRILCIGEPGELAAEVEALGVPLHALRQAPGRNLRLPWLLAHHFRRFASDVIHTHGPYAHLYGSLAARLLARCPLVHTKHGYLWPRTPRRDLQNRLAALLSQQIVAVSQDLADYLRGTEKLSARKLRLVYNGIDASRFSSPNGRLAHSDLPVAVMVSRLSTEKDFETLFRAVAIVVRHFPDFELRLIGDGPIRMHLESLVDDIAVQQSVRFLGNRTDIPQQLADAQLFVLSSNTEGMSIALLEAMAARLPVVATSVGGNPEVIVDGKTGFLVKRRAPDQMAEKMCWLLTHRAEAEAMGEAGRQRIEDHFDIRQTIIAYEMLYLDVTGQSLSHVARDGSRSAR